MAVTPRRQQWAVQTMRVAPGDRVLEIGCGHGIAAELVCAQLTTGRITAIDRSAQMIRVAEQRNATGIASGRARFQAVDLDAADLPEHRFDKIFSVNVSLFWLGTGPGQIEKVKSLLAPGGVLYIFNEPPKPQLAQAIGDRAEALLTRHGFATSRSSAVGHRGLPLTCVAGTPPWVDIGANDLTKSLSPDP